MKIIVLSGKENSGKTETLRILAGKFCIVLTPKAKSEITVIIKTKSKNIAITSKGDCTRDIKNEFNKIMRCGCKIDTFICACHPNNTNCHNFLRKISKNLHFVSKTISNSKSKYLTTNINDAKILYGLI